MTVMGKALYRVLMCMLATMLWLPGCLFGVSAEEPPAPAVADISWGGDEQPKPNAEVTFTVHLKGNGGEIAKGTAITVDFYVNSEKLFTQTYIDGIPADKTVAVTLPKWKAVEGEHTVTAVLNSTVAKKKLWDSGLFYTEHIRVAQTALPVPQVALDNGMNTLMFSDDFTTLGTVDTESTGGYGYKWYTQQPYGGVAVSSDNYELTDSGVLLKTEPVKNYYTFSTLDPRSGTGWGYTHGYMEVRLRMPANRVLEGSTGFPSVWSLDPEKLMYLPNTHWVELDFMEYWGDDWFSTTLHDQYRLDESSVTRERWYKNGNFNCVGLGDGEWHTMGFVWCEGMLKSYLDGEEYQAVYWSADEKPYPPATIKNDDGTDTVGAFTVLDEQWMPLIVNGAAGWSLELDYIRVWQNDGETATPTVPGPTAAQFIDMYLSDGFGNLQTTINADNYALVLDAEEPWKALTAEQQQDVDAVLTENGANPFMKLLKSAAKWKVDADSFINKYALTKDGVVCDPTEKEACHRILAGKKRFEKLDEERQRTIDDRLSEAQGTTYTELLQSAQEAVASGKVEAPVNAAPRYVAGAVVFVAGVAVAVWLIIWRKRRSLKET